MTMDETVRPTPGELLEWGNPINDSATFAMIRAYSRYDNMWAQPYPPMLIAGGINDPLVTYWEPAKWAPKLCADKSDANLLLLKINLGAVHVGKSGRWERARKMAETYAFVLVRMR